LRGCGSRQRDGEFREYAGLGLNVDCAPLLFHDDVVAAGLGREERIEYFLRNFWWDTTAIVADADFDFLAIRIRAPVFSTGMRLLGRLKGHALGRSLRNAHTTP
jgi:hypothetical protein